MGDTISIYHEGKQFLLNVLETQPSNAVCIISEPYLDVKIEFAVPLDFRESMELPSDLDEISNISPKESEKPNIPEGKILSQESLPDTIEYAICSNW